MLFSRDWLQRNAELEEAAYQLADEVRSANEGASEGVADEALLDELRRRCPGFPSRRYRDALARALFATE